MLYPNKSGLFFKQIAHVCCIASIVFFAAASSSVTVYAQENNASSAGEMLSAKELETLIGPIALYADELIAIVLPATTYPLEIVLASRYLEQHKIQPDLKPSENWDSSVLGLLNYPEVIEVMNDDLDWTWRLGEAVVNQQNEVMDAIQQFRARVHTAGNLETDEKQVIVVEKEVIKIVSATPEVIYVPTYNPSTVIIYSTVPYRYIYSAPYPYYYSPAAAFWTGMFIGAAIRYGVGWRGGRWGGNNNINININRNTINHRGGNTWRPNRGGGQVGRPGGGTRPGAGIGYRPGYGSGQRPAIGQRPSAGQRPAIGQRPSAGQRPAIGQRPSAGQRPATGQRPSAGQRPATGQRPSAGQRPATGQRPSIGQRPFTGQRPSVGQRPATGNQINRGSFGGYNRGQTTSRNSNRGAFSRSRQSMGGARAGGVSRRR